MKVSGKWEKQNDKAVEIQEAVTNIMLEVCSQL